MARPVNTAPSTYVAFDTNALVKVVDLGLVGALVDRLVLTRAALVVPMTAIDEFLSRSEFLADRVNFIGGLLRSGRLRLTKPFRAICQREVRGRHGRWMAGLQVHRHLLSMFTNGCLDDAHARAFADFLNFKSVQKERRRARIAQARALSWPTDDLLLNQLVNLDRLDVTILPRATIKLCRFSKVSTEEICDRGRFVTNRTAVALGFVAVMSECLPDEIKALLPPGIFRSGRNDFADLAIASEAAYCSAFVTTDADFSRKLEYIGDCFRPVILSLEQFLKACA